MFRTLNEYTGFTQENISSDLLKDTNLLLRGRLKALVSEIDQLFAPCSTSLTRRSQPLEELKSSRAMKRELLSLQEKLEQTRQDIEARYRGSSMRLLEDQIKATRKKVGEAYGEIEVLEAEALSQIAAIGRVKTSAIVEDLQSELAIQKKINVDLRRSNTDLEHQVRVKQRICGQLEEQLSRSVNRKGFSSDSIRG